MMPSPGEKIAILRDYLQPALKQRDLAKKLGVSTSLIGMWESDSQQVPRKRLEELQDLFGVPVSWFLEDTDTVPPLPMLAKEMPAIYTSGKLLSVGGIPMAKVPVVGKVAAGNESFGDHSGQFVSVPTVLTHVPGVTGWEVEGDSMMPHLQPGDIALFKPHSQPRTNGVPFLIRQGPEHRCKVLKYESGNWVLHSFNPRYPDEPFPERAQIIGYLVGWYRSKGTRETMDSDSAGLSFN